MHQYNRIRNPHLKTQIIITWSTWVLLGEHYGFDPYENVDHSIDEDGGNSRNWEYIGDIPEKEEETEAQIFMKNWLETKEVK